MVSSMISLFDGAENNFFVRRDKKLKTYSNLVASTAAGSF